MTINNDIIIIGCGVSGLSCGIILQEYGYKTSIVAANIPPSTTSDIAPAYWYPYRVNPLERVLKWGAISYEYFTKLSSLNGSGVSMTNLIKLYDNEVPIPSWAEITKKFRILSISELPDGYQFGFSSEVPLIETPIYMYYLFNRYIQAQGRVIKLKDNLKSISRYTENHKILVNCTGLGSINLFNDNRMYPIRGQLVRVTNPGISNIYSDQDGRLSLSYIVPRSGDCILGGTADDNNWDTRVNNKISNKILTNCKKIIPQLEESIVLEHKVGLRPGRDNVRLESEQLENCHIIHNYGHGGAGFTLSWGCAEEVRKIVRDLN